MGGSGSKEERLEKVNKSIRSTEKKIKQASNSLNRDLHDGTGRPINKKDHERFLKLSDLRRTLDDLHKESSRIYLEEQQIPGVGYEKGGSSFLASVSSKIRKKR